MQYEGTIIRPPSEANSIILQATVGCSHNACTFCGAYKEKQFRIRKESIGSDIEFAAKHCFGQRRVFLADGDALIIPYKTLLDILKKIRNTLPWVNRISTYANAKAIRSKSLDELKVLHEYGLDRIYMGLESGSDLVLNNIHKGETAQSMIDAASLINECGFFLSVTVLLGIGGVELSNIHALETGKVLNRMVPNQIAALTLMPLENTPLHREIIRGTFTLPGSPVILDELKTIIQTLSINRVQFYANHASNFLRLSGRLQKDRQSLIDQIEEAQKGTVPLIEDAWRSL